VGCALLGVLLLLLVAEGAMRLCLGNNAVGRLMKFDRNDLPCVILKKNARVTHTGLFKKISPVVHAVNRYGYRGPARPPRATASVRRIVVVGDSFTFCPGVAEKRDYPSRLEFHLNQRGDTNTEVLNFGVPSHNLAELEAHLMTDAVRFSPDVVLMQITQNDFSPTVCQLTQHWSESTFSLLHHLYLGRVVFAEMLAATQRYESPQEERLAALDRFALSVQRIASEHGALARIISFDEPVTCSDNCLEHLFEKHELPYWPFPEQLRAHLHRDMGHLDETGCDLYARELANWLHSLDEAS